MARTVLVVDDDPQYVELVKDLLELHHYRVLTALNGSAALRILQQHRVEVIVSDIEMPLMNGISFHQKIAQQPDLCNIPFIFLTGSEEAHYYRYVEQHPAMHLVRKTEMVDRLLTVLEKA